MFNIAKLTPSLLFGRIADDVQDPKTSLINLVRMNPRIINCHKNWNIFPDKKSIKIKEKKPILRTGLRGLQLLRTK